MFKVQHPHTAFGELLRLGFANDHPGVRLAITATVCVMVLSVVGLLVLRFVVLHPQPLHDPNQPAVRAP
jgi:hypothetical protein